MRQRAAAGLTTGGETSASLEALSPDERIAERARQIGAMFSAEPQGYDAFGTAFRAQVPDAALDQLFKQYYAEHGAVVHAEIIGPFTGGVTVVRFRFADGNAAIMQFNLEPNAPYQVAGALMGPAFELGDDAEGEAAEAGGGAVQVGELTYPTDTIVPQTRLRLPFGSEWTVFWGGRTLAENYHRASAAQRYAYDFVVTRDGSTHTGAGTSNEDYYCEGEPIVAGRGSRRTSRRRDRREQAGRDESGRTARQPRCDRAPQR